MSSTEGLGKKQLHGVSLTAVANDMPADGIPMFQTWKSLALGIYWQGYNSLREPLECRERDPTASHWQLQCTKGLGRLSVILFGVFWTFLHKEDVKDPVMADFRRRCGECFSLKTIGHPDVKLNGCQYGSILLSPETVIYSKAQCL